METAAAEDLRESETDDQEHDDREDRPERTGQTRPAASGALGPLTGEALAPVRVRLLRPRVVAGDVAEARRHALRLRIPAAEAPGADVSPADVPAPEIGVGTLRTVIEIGRPPAGALRPRAAVLAAQPGRVPTRTAIITPPEILHAPIVGTALPWDGTPTHDAPHRRCPGQRLRAPAADEGVHGVADRPARRPSRPWAAGVL